MSEITPPDVDLLGDPWCELKGPGGRPPLRVREQDAEKVANLRALGMSGAEIARSLGVSEPTLRKYFFAELELGDAVVRGKLIDCLVHKAEEGNVAALKEALRRMDPLPRRGRAAPKLGKKELARAAAHEDPDEDWADLIEPPERLN